MEENYKKPYKFNTNLYAAFIKKCCEVIEDKGKMAIVHPPTFMYIKTFEDVRKFIVDKMHISLFVEWGYLGMFNPLARVDSAMYILENEIKNELTHFIKLNDLYEGKRYDALQIAYDDLCNNRPNALNYTLDQAKLKIIEGWPFIYWISDGFREKFKEPPFEKHFHVCNGISSGGNNERFYRYLWEVDRTDISIDYNVDKKKWVRINKGGGFNRWYGNLWLLFEWADNGKQLKNLKKNVPAIRHGFEEFYFKEGLAFTGATSKGLSVRYQPPNCIFERAGKSIFVKTNTVGYSFALGFLNSHLCTYIIDALNPTVSVQSGDIERIPLVLPSVQLNDTIVSLVNINIALKKELCTYELKELDYEGTALTRHRATSLHESISKYLSLENANAAAILVNEAIINKLIFQVFSLSVEDEEKVISKTGNPVGNLPIISDARNAYLEAFPNTSDVFKSFVADLPTIT